MHSYHSTLSAAHLPRALYTASQVRELDRIAIEEHGIPAGHLMQRAGRAALAALLARWPAPPAIHIFCGTGNNGGDGFVVAQLAHERGIPTFAWQVGDPERIGGTAQAARHHAMDAGVCIRAFEPAAWREAGANGGVAVDALLGTGLGGPVRPAVSEAISSLAASGMPVVAIDVPSGLCSDTGAELGTAVRAELTATFVGLKRGLFTGRGPACAGEVVFDDLAVPSAAYAAIEPQASRLLAGDDLQRLAPRPRDAHKGHHGHVLMVGGDQGMLGAALLASEAAGRVGAGLVSCATRPEYAALLTIRRPEVMGRGVRSGADLAPLIARATVIAIGPGLGQRAWGGQMLAQVMASGLPLVLDADALNLLAAARGKARRCDRWVLTPHPGEAGRLLGISTAEVERDRFQAAAELQRRWGGVVVLKGAGTLIADGAAIRVSNFGNPGMAAGGMGDVLTGVIAGLIAQGLPLAQAARVGVALHGQAGDWAAQAGERGLLASDLFPHLRRLVNQ